MKYSQLVVETWSVYEAFRKLGFRDEEIETSVGNARNPITGVQSREMVYVKLARGDKNFVYTLRPCDRSFEKFRDDYDKFRADIAEQRISDAELTRLWRSTELGKHEELFALLAMKVSEKGIRVPILEN